MGGLEHDPLAIRDAHFTGKRLVDLYEIIYEGKLSKK
jgi:hypothetical protein